MAKKVIVDQKKNKKTQGKDILKTIDALLLEEKIVEARSAYESISKLGRSPATDNIKAKAASTLVDWYVERRHLDKVTPLCQALARRSDNSEILTLLIEAVGKIAQAHVNEGQPDQARELRLSLWRPLAGEDAFGEVLGNKDTEWLSLYLDMDFKNRLPEAINIFQIINVEDAPPEVEKVLAKISSYNIILAQNRGQRDQALAFFEVAENLFKNHLDENLALNLCYLACALSLSGRLPEALKIYAIFEATQTRFLKLRTLVATALIEALVFAERYEEALEIWLKAPMDQTLEKNSEAGLIKEANNLLQALSLNGQAESARALWLELEAKYFSQLPYWEKENQSKPIALFYVAQAIVLTYWRDKSDNNKALLIWLADEMEKFEKQWDPVLLKGESYAIFRSSKAGIIYITQPAFIDADLPESPMTPETEPITHLFGQAEAVNFQLGQIARQTRGETELDPESLSRQETLLKTFLEIAREIINLLINPECLPLWRSLVDTGLDISFLTLNGSNLLIQATSHLLETNNRTEAIKLYDETPWLLILPNDDLSAATRATYSLSRSQNIPDRERVDFPEGQQIYGQIMEMFLAAVRNNEPAVLENKIMSYNCENLKYHISLVLAVKLADKLKQNCYYWIEKDELNCVEKILAFMAMLGDHPRIKFHHHTATIAYLTKCLRKDGYVEAIYQFGRERDYLASNREEFVSDDPEAEKYQWLDLAILESATRLAGSYHNLLIRNFMDQFITKMADLSDLKLYRLTYLGLLSLVLEKASETQVFPPANNMAEPAEFFKIYYAKLMSAQTEGLAPMEASWLESRQSLVRRVYPKILLRAKRREEALENYEAIFANQVSTGEELQAQAEFIKELIISFAEAGEFEKAQTWYNQLLSLGPLNKPLAYEWMVAATRLILALAQDNRLDEAQQTLDLLGDDPLLLHGRLVSMTFIFCAHMSQNEGLEMALKTYTAARELPFSKSIHLLRTKTLANLIKEFAKIGETNTAYHLFVNREIPDEEILTEEVWPEAALINDLVTSPKALEDLETILWTNDIEAYTTELENIYLYLADKVVELIGESLILEEDSVALNVYRALEELNIKDPDPINLASKLIVENLVNKGLRAEAQAIIDARLAKLTTPTSSVYLLSVNKIMGTGANQPEEEA
ncbi:MAG: hypothetical protein LBT38_07650 [Deltaproteobacteria bacterium]|jgi:tetratricopeptide (TPR) repeat protein|nr:hypothetical protein [Deltaproteobacteria bacterium]